jgi:hypothetical protein
MRTVLYILLALLLSQPVYADLLDDARKLKDDGEKSLKDPIKPPAPPPIPDLRKSPAQNIKDQEQAIKNDAATLADQAKRATDMQIQLAKDGIKISTDSATFVFSQLTEVVRNAIDGFLKDKKAEFWAFITPYLYLAAAAFLAILLVPAILSSMVSVWIIRRRDRRRLRATR